MGALACFAIPVGVDQTGNTELILISVPSKRHDDIRRISHINISLGQRERPLAFVGKNNSGKITLLQPLDQTFRYSRIMAFDIEQGRPAVAADKTVAGLRSDGQYLAGAVSGVV